MQGGKQITDAHPITVKPLGQRVTVRLGDKTLADSTNALVLQESTYAPVYYIPRADVAMDGLTPTATSTHCPYKGDASYYAAPGKADVAWSYEDPFDQLSVIKDHIAFYPDRVDAIEVAPRG